MYVPLLNFDAPRLQIKILRNQSSLPTNRVVSVYSSKISRVMNVHGYHYKVASILLSQLFSCSVSHEPKLMLTYT
jgi:hypothetical protein